MVGLGAVMAEYGVLDLSRKSVDEDSLGGEESAAGRQSVTSLQDAGDKSTQEVEYGSKVTGTNGRTEDDELNSILHHRHNQQSSFVNGTGSDDEEMADHNTDLDDSLPHDLSLKPKVKDTLEDNIDLDQEELYSPPSEHVRDRFCVYCNMVTDTPSELEQHLQQHLTERPFHCSTCDKQFKSKQGLQRHEYTQHGDNLEEDSNIAQSYQLPLKRSYDQSSQQSLLSEPMAEFSTSKSPAYSSPSHDANSSFTGSAHLGLETSASKRQRINELPQSLSSSAITPETSESVFDLRVARSIEPNLKGTYDGADAQEMKGCPVCAKMFPKPSDLKRHMMCHTGEKPFRCQYCNKPFRAKSSMHYHLKATHGLEIELSPGLEERYLRMKTRAQINLMQRGGQLTNFTSGSQYASENGDRFPRDIDIDELEDESKSNDSSFFHNSGIGSADLVDTKSQGFFNNTGSDYKSAVDLSMSEKGNNALTNGIFILSEEGPFRRKKLRVRNETVLITRLDGLDLTRGTSASVYKCYLCGKMFNTLSKMQCHLSLHFERQVTSYECCFCEEIFQFKSQMRNHMRRRHAAISNDKTKNPTTIRRQGTQNQSNSTKCFTCTYCHKSFNDKISLHKHTRLHFWNRNCFCRICGKSFNHYTSLQLHISRFHWKTTGKLGATSSGIHKKLNFFNAPRFKFNSHDGIPKHSINEPLDLIKEKTYQNEAQMPSAGVTIVMPRSPRENGDLSDGGSHHSSENNWSESLSDNPAVDTDEGGKEIRSAPRRSLLPFRGESSPRGRSSRKSTPTHLQPHNQLTSDNNVPLNFIKTETPSQQDTNNNENHRLTPEKPPLLSSATEALIPGYTLNATSHLMMAKALAAHQTLTQHLNHTSQPLLYPPNHLPPSLAAMSQMMSLPLVIPSTSSEPTASTSKSPSPASYTSSKSDTSPDDRDARDSRESLVGYPRVSWGQKTPPDWTFNMYCPQETNHTDGRKVTSLSRTHSRLGIVHSPVNRESLCKPTVLSDGRTVYKCPFCSKEFVSFSDINRHMDFHEGKTKDIRPYKCQYCDYFARTNSQLKVHMMRHQGIREFCCKLCNYKGVTQSDLNRHMKSQIHMLKSRNACTYCGEGFVTSKNLEKHLDGNCIVKMQKLNGGLDIPIQAGLV